MQAASKANALRREGFTTYSCVVRVGIGPTSGLGGGYLLRSEREYRAGIFYLFARRHYPLLENLRRIQLRIRITDSFIAFLKLHSLHSLSISPDLFAVFSNWMQFSERAGNSPQIPPYKITAAFVAAGITTQAH